MHLSVKDIPDHIAEEVTHFVFSKNFLDLVQDPDRNLHRFVSLYYIHANESCGKILPTDTLFLSRVDEYTGIAIYQLGFELNRSSTILWFVEPKMSQTVSTDFGLVTFNSTEYSRSAVTLYSRLDFMWIGGNQQAAVLTIDHGSSHVVT